MHFVFRFLKDTKEIAETSIKNICRLNKGNMRPEWEKELHKYNWNCKNSSLITNRICLMSIHKAAKKALKRIKEEKEK